MPIGKEENHDKLRFDDWYIMFDYFPVVQAHHQPHNQEHQYTINHYHTRGHPKTTATIFNHYKTLSKCFLLLLTLKLARSK